MLLASAPFCSKYFYFICGIIISLDFWEVESIITFENQIEKELSGQGTG